MYRRGYGTSASVIGTVGAMTSLCKFIRHVWRQRYNILLRVLLYCFVGLVQNWFFGVYSYAGSYWFNFDTYVVEFKFFVSIKTPNLRKNLSSEKYRKFALLWDHGVDVSVTFGRYESGPCSC